MNMYNENDQGINCTTIKNYTGVQMSSCRLHPLSPVGFPWLSSLVSKAEIITSKETHSVVMFLPHVPLNRHIASHGNPFLCNRPTTRRIPVLWILQIQCDIRSNGCSVTATFSTKHKGWTFMNTSEPEVDNCWFMERGVTTSARYIY